MENLGFFNFEKQTLTYIREGKRGSNINAHHLLHTTQSFKQCDKYSKFIVFVMRMVFS